jgi:hypothetical protein
MLSEIAEDGYHKTQTALASVQLVDAAGGGDVVLRVGWLCCWLG